MAHVRMLYPANRDFNSGLLLLLIRSRWLTRNFRLAQTCSIATKFEVRRQSDLTITSYHKPQLHRLGTPAGMVVNPSALLVARAEPHSTSTQQVLCSPDTAFHQGSMRQPRL